MRSTLTWAAIAAAFALLSGVFMVEAMDYLTIYRGLNPWLSVPGCLVSASLSAKAICNAWDAFLDWCIYNHYE